MCRLYDKAGTLKTARDETGVRGVHLVAPHGQAQHVPFAFKFKYIKIEHCTDVMCCDQISIIINRLLRNHAVKCVLQCMKRL